jgi:hypothetical protein
MKTRLLSLFIPLFATTLLAQNDHGVPPSAVTCGSSSVLYSVKSDDDAAISAPAAGMATLVLIEDQLQTRPGHAVCLKCETRLQYGLDGQSIGATRGFSHISVSIAPGDHHLCASGNGPVFTADPLPSFFALHVEAGKTYFVSTRLALYSGYGVAVLDISRLNDDEGRYLVSISKRTLFTKK